MKTSHKIAGPRAIRKFNYAFALMIPAALCVAVPLIIEGFSWSNAFIFLGVVILGWVPVLITRALRTIHESDKAARAAGEKPLYLERLLDDPRSSIRASVARRR